MAEMDAKIFSENIARTMDSAEQVTRVLEFCLIGSDGNTDFFNTTAKKLYDKLDYVNSIQLAPNGVVSQIYPSDGNEKGYIDLMNDPDRGPVVRYGKEQDVITDQGPFDLNQGGKGIAIRDPVFLSDGSFWGFTITIVDSDKLIRSVTKSIKENNYYYLLEKTESIKKNKYLTVTKSGTLSDPVTYTFESGASKWKLSIERKGGWFHSDDFLIINLLGFAIVILIVWLFYMLMIDHDRQEALIKAANVDFLTGLLNRQGIDEKSAGYFSKNADKPFVAIMLDIDNFKIINDCYGHETGDNALKALSSALSQNFKGDEIIGRYGGDEFFILLKDTTPDQVQVSLKKFMAQEIRYKTGATTTDVVSISIGYASYPDDSDDPEEVVRLADQALYNSKEHGKNRFEAYSEV
ncbi:MAG: diguanylate cyclase domain-containing protein [Candidatus Weimeria sp.]